MKKKNLIIYIFFVMVVMLVPSKADAALNCLNDDKACVVCTYEHKDAANNKIIFRFKAWEENSNVKYESEIDGDKIKPSFSNTSDSVDLSSSDFISRDKKRLSCKSLYFATLANYNYKVSNQQKKGYELLQLTGENNNHKELTAKTKVCKFKAKLKDTMNNDKGEINIEFNITDNKTISPTDTTGEYKIYFNDGLNAKSFGSGNECEYSGGKLYILCQIQSSGKVCNIGTKETIFSEETEITDPNDSNKENADKKPITSEKTGNNCEGVLGDVMGIIDEVFDIVKIAAPILLIVFGTLDFSQAVLQDNQDMLKKATSKFIKRAIATIAIFFVPLLVRLLLSLPGMEELGLPDDPLCGLSKVVLK